MTIGEAIHSGAKLIKNKLNRFEAELLLVHVLSCTREHILTHPEIIITKKSERTFLQLITNRQRGWPIAYLVGQQAFYGLDFEVTPSVLIPRPETELIIEQVLALSHITNQPLTIIDIGTGSGCIAITLAKLLPNAKVTAVDISSNALTVAKRNAMLHQVDITFIKNNLLVSLKTKDFIHNKTAVPVFIANLPYLTRLQIDTSPSIAHEPRLALDGGEHGLVLYQKLFKQINSLNLSAFDLFCEIDPSQKQRFTTLAKQSFPDSTFTLLKDLRGHNRLGHIKKRSH
ncbi:MAG: peptide chain release factor N(5)-glutamine methyltransferase [Candidatus Falkowbacteria bacterium]